MTRSLSKSSPSVSDQSRTTLGTGIKVEKNSPPIEALGAIDELNGWIGVFVSLSVSQDRKELFTYIQHDLADLGAQMSVPGTPLLSQAHVARIEKSLNRMNTDLATRCGNRGKVSVAKRRQKKRIGQRLIEKSNLQAIEFRCGFIK